MVHLEIARSANAALAAAQPLTAVFPGGTSGIGEFTIRTLASYYAKSEHALRVYIIGRSRHAADKIISDCQETCPKGEFRFIEARDLSLLRDVDRCCDAVIKAESEGSVTSGYIDLLVMSHADLHFGGRRETTEGLDKSMSLLYYSRMRFITKLLPLLHAAPRSAHVISVYAAGLENPKDWDQDDLSLRKVGRDGFRTCRSHGVISTTFFMESLADQNKDKLSLVHVFPSLVITPAFRSSSHPLWFKIVWTLLGPIAGLFAVSAEEIGERILFLASERYPAQISPGPDAREISEMSKPPAELQLDFAVSTNGICGGGAYSCKYDGETCALGDTYKKLREEDAGSAIWEHTMAVFRTIEADEVFRD